MPHANYSYGAPPLPVNYGHVPAAPPAPPAQQPSQPSAAEQQRNQMLWQQHYQQQQQHYQQQQQQQQQSHAYMPTSRAPHAAHEPPAAVGNPFDLRLRPDQAADKQAAATRLRAAGSRPW